MDGLYVGLMSGTSVDSLDLALADISSDGLRLVHSISRPWSELLRSGTLSLFQPGENEVQRLGSLDVQIGLESGRAVLDLLHEAAVKPGDVLAIGSHGQTIRHVPTGDFPFTLQIGDPNRIAQITGIAVVADMRRMDMAASGQGAPLVPPFHSWMFGDVLEPRTVVNLGGIANISCVPARANRDSWGGVVGFDTGPANTLMDFWIRKNRSLPFDRSGEWAASGTVHAGLLQNMLGEPYFQQSGPKSTGPETFSPGWLEGHLKQIPESIQAQDVQATLLELTVRTLTDSIQKSMPDCVRVILCGGGVNNPVLVRGIQHSLSQMSVESAAQYGLDPDLVEAAAFAWLAWRRMNSQTANLPRVTGASRSVILGGLYLP